MASSPLALCPLSYLEPLKKQRDRDPHASATLTSSFLTAEPSLSKIGEKKRHLSCGLELLAKRVTTPLGVPVFEHIR